MAQLGVSRNSIWHVRAFVLFLSVLVIFGSYMARASSRLYYWSAPSTWGGHVPSAGDHVVIPSGKTIILDVSPPPLASIDVQGTLSFADNRDLDVVAGSITVHGLFQVGTHESPYKRHASITLTSSGGDMGMKSIDVGKAGVLEMHGLRPGVDWERLSATAQAGSTSIRMEKAAKWKTGDHIVIASTDFDPHQAEEVTVTAVQGKIVEFTPALQFMHYGEVLPSGVDERAEVGLLTRNILVQGDIASDADEMGGEIMVTAGGKAHLEAIELTRMGKLGMKGHYPIHFHLVGDGAGMYVEDTALHHCYNRCITIHGTNSVLLNSNVAYDTIGHCYFLEDGNETKNVLTDNLGILTKSAEPGHQVLDSDLGPGTFWITNPDNVLRGNVAAGSDRYGFWYALPKHPTGFAASAHNDKTVWNRRTPLGEFRYNTSHSNDDSGLFVDPGPNPYGVFEAPTYDPKVNTVPVYGKADVPAVAYFADFTGYKNRKRGIWLRGSYLDVINAKLADNATGATLACSHSSLMNSVIVGESDNVGTPAEGELAGLDGRTLPKPYAPRTALCGFELYDGPISGQNIRFVNFKPNAQREASGLGYLRFTPYYVDFRNYVSGLTFENSKKVFLENLQVASEKNSGDGYRSSVFLDKDGSVTGIAGTYVAAKDALLVDATDTYMPEWNAYLCQGPFARVFVENRDTEPARMSPVSMNRDDLPHSVFRMWGVPAPQTDNVSFQTNVLPNRFFRVMLGGKAPTTLRFTLRADEPSQWTMLRLPEQNPRRVKVSADQPGLRPLAQLPDTEMLKASATSGYCVDGQSVVVKLVATKGYAWGEGVAYVTRG